MWEYRAYVMRKICVSDLSLAVKVRPTYSLWKGLQTFSIGKTPKGLESLHAKRVLQQPSELNKQKIFKKAVPTPLCPRVAPPSVAGKLWPHGTSQDFYVPDDFYDFDPEPPLPTHSHSPARCRTPQRRWKWSGSRLIAEIEGFDGVCYEIEWGGHREFKNGSPEWGESAEGAIW